MSDNRGIQLLKQIAYKFKAFFFSKDALSFLFFLLLTAAFWFSNTANKAREANITIPLRYSALPKDYAIINQPPQEIKLSIRDEGLNLFSYSKKRLVPLNIDLSQIDDKKGYSKLSSEQILSRLSYYLHPTTSIINFTPDSIFVQYEKMESVVLPIKLELDIELAQQYILSDTIRVIPDKVTAYGSKEALKNLKEVPTEYLVLSQLKGSVLLKVRLLPIESVIFSIDEVDVRAKAEMFTERRTQVPVMFSNVPNNLSIRTFPALVDITYNIGLSHYDTSYDNITVFVDYHDIKQNKQDKQKLKVISNSSKIFNIKIVPEEVEFILEEKLINNTFVIGNR